MKIYKWTSNKGFSTVQGITWLCCAFTSFPVWFEIVPIFWSNCLTAWNRKNCNRTQFKRSLQSEKLKSTFIASRHDIDFIKQHPYSVDCDIVFKIWLLDLSEQLPSSSDKFPFQFAFTRPFRQKLLHKFKRNFVFTAFLLKKGQEKQKLFKTRLEIFYAFAVTRLIKSSSTWKANLPHSLSTILISNNKWSERNVFNGCWRMLAQSIRREWTNRTKISLTRMFFHPFISPMIKEKLTRREIMIMIAQESTHKRCASEACYFS